jgi:3-hydroxybutyrate dehydrogenase
MLTASGINLDFARLLLEHGANVVFADLALRPEAEALVNKYQSQPRAVFQKTDVTSWAQLEGMFKAAIDNFGQVDIVCPGAGVFEPPFSNFWIPPGTKGSKDTIHGDRYTSLDINITHPIRVTQMAISHFLSASPPASTSNPKSIIHIASIAGESASLPFPLYHAAKHAVFAFVKSLADLQDQFGIRVAAVLPGIVKTPLWMDHPEKLKVVRQEGKDKDEWVTPEETAEAMLALVKDNEIVSEEGSAGEKIPIVGGTCLEVLAKYVRDVPILNNTGPYATGKPGHSVSDAAKIYTEVLGTVKTPGWGKPQSVNGA